MAMRWALLALALLTATSMPFAALLEIGTLNLLMGATAFLVILMLAILEMASRSMNLPQLQAWTKTELREVLASALLLVIIYSILGSMGLLSTLTGQANPEQTARTFLQQQITGTQYGYEQLMRLMHYMTMRASYSMNFTTPAYYVYATYASGPYGGFSVLLGPLNMAGQGLLNAWFGYLGTYVLFEFGIRIAWLALPIGFIFRFIPFTRTLGTTLIALAIGAKVMLPLGIVLVSQFHQMITVPNLTIPEADIDKVDISNYIAVAHGVCSLTPIRILFSITETIQALLVGSLCGPYFSVCYNMYLYVIYPIIDLVLRAVYLIIFAASGGFGPYIGIGGAEGAEIVFNFLRQVNNYALLSYIDIVIIALVAYIGTKSVSTALGGDYMMGAVSRFVR